MIQCKSWCQRTRWLAAMGAVFLHWAFAVSASAQDQTPATGGVSAQPVQTLVTNLQGLVIVPRAEDVNQSGLTGVRGVVIKGPRFLQRPDFERFLNHYLGSPLTDASLSQMQVEIRKYCQTHDHLVVDVISREQELLEDTIQIAVIEAKVGKITVVNDGRKWFSDSVILRDLRLKPGDVVLESHLNNDLSWMNRNNYQSLGYDGFNGSFRDVSTSFHQGRLGETDLDLKVEDRLPFRPFVGIEDSGIEEIGRDRLFAGFNWANAFGLDHRLTYEYVTDTDFNKLSEHVGSYVIPLPWRHELTLFGAYADVNPDFSLHNFSNLKSKGTFYQLSGRYSVPLPPLGKLEHELSAGFDFKRTDTPLLFVTGTAFTTNNILKTNNIDVAQFILAYSGRIADSRGMTFFSLQGVYSPGDLTKHNKRADYQDFSPGTKPEYAYARVEFRRETLLPYGFLWHLRAMGQYADAKLGATEVFSLGGYDTVRGYDERIVSGDHGWLVINELRTKRFPLGSLTGKANAIDWIQGLVFCDYGEVINRNLQPLQRYNEVLVSVGAGLRYAVADNFHVRLDYGFQLDREYASGPSFQNLKTAPDNRRAHFGVELSF
jgi:hemolysin activation/secretion protein